MFLIFTKELKIDYKTGTGIIQPGNGINSSSSWPMIQNFLLQNTFLLNQKLYWHTFSSVHLFWPICTYLNISWPYRISSQPMQDPACLSSFSNIPDRAKLHFSCHPPPPETWTLLKSGGWGGGGTIWKHLLLLVKFRETFLEFLKKGKCLDANPVLMEPSCKWLNVSWMYIVYV